MARNQDNVTGWGDMPIRRPLFHVACTIKIQLSVLVSLKADLIPISLKINLFWSWYRWTIAELALKNNHSLTLKIIHKWGWTTNLDCDWVYGEVVVRRVAISGIVDFHCINFFFHKTSSKGWRIKPSVGTTMRLLSFETSKSDL